MPNYLVQAVLSHDTGLPSDVTVNTWHWQATTVGDLEDVFGILQQFYETVDVYLSSSLSGVITYKAYNLADPTPRVPVATEVGALTLGGSQGPPQVALVASFQADPISGSSQARRRNRVFLGPVADTANVDTTGRPQPAFIAAARDGMETMFDSAAVDGDINWLAWSDTLGTGATVTNGWVDNRWDTQRRRLVPATARYPWPT